MLRLKYREQISCALAILQLRNLESLPRRIHFALQVFSCLAGIGHFDQSILNVHKGIEHGTLVVGDELLLGADCKCLLSREPPGVEDRLQ